MICNSVKILCPSCDHRCVTNEMSFFSAGSNECYSLVEKSKSK